MNQTTTDNDTVKSKAVVKYSASQSPATFAQLQCNTDLNLPPANWLSSSGSIHGLQHVLSNSTGFSSFRMAHMFPDCVGQVDVISDAENIKNLLKLPYSRGQVSMMVHRVENTLLLDNFDIYKHLLRTAEKEWEWLRKFFYDNVKKFTEKDRHLYLQNKSRNALQQRSLVSKFLYHSLVETFEENNSENNERYETFSISGPVLPDPNFEEELPDTSNHTYNRNVVWTFEDIRMLIGTDMPIFGGSTHPCISLRLRDMNSPINVLTGIDYWLDNLMCNVPEVIMCYHLNGIVQKYELVKTEDLPDLENSKFSPTVIRDLAQNILSFLKSNATKPGHTYWLFKSKDDDVVKLYDLTSLCDEQGITGQNPFTVPVAMLLYTVARNMDNSTRRKQPGTKRMLLKYCLDLLQKEKHPQIVTSAYYMLADLYIPSDTNPATPGLEEIENDDESCYEDDLHEEEEAIMKQLRLGKDTVTNDFVYKPPPPITGTLEERCDAALQNVVCGLECLQYFPSQDEDIELKRKMELARKREEEDNPTMAKPFQAIPMPYYTTLSDTSNDKQPTKKGKKRKNKATNAVLLKQNHETIPSWKKPERIDQPSWNAHLKTLLYEKACLVFAILSEKEYSCNNFGSSLKYAEMLVQCYQPLKNMKFYSRIIQESYWIGKEADSIVMMVKNFDKIDIYKDQYKKTMDIQQKLMKELKKENLDFEEFVFPELCDEESLLLCSITLYQKALSLNYVQDEVPLYRHLGNVQNELGTLYLRKLSEKNIKFHDFYNKSMTFFQSAMKSFMTVRDDHNLALIHSNMGRLMRTCAYYYGQETSSKKKAQEQEKQYYDKAVNCYQTALQVLGNRRTATSIWDTIMWELSGAVYTRASQLQDYPVNKNSDSAEREVVDTLQLALRYCDMETPGPRQLIYQFRVASIHYRLASLYHHIYRRQITDTSRRKHILQLCKLHYERACNIFTPLEQHNELLKSYLEWVALNEFVVKNTPISLHTKIDYLQQNLKLLLNTIPSLIWLHQKGLENLDNSKMDSIDNNNIKNETTQSEEFDIDSQGKIFTNSVEQQLQYALRMLAKYCLNTTTMYKTLYSITLKINVKLDWLSRLERLIFILKKVKICLEK